MDIMTKIEEVVRKLEWAQRENTELQRNSDPGSTQWQKHVIIDDRLQEAITALGH